MDIQGSRLRHSELRREYDVPMLANAAEQELEVDVSHQLMLTWLT